MQDSWHRGDKLSDCPLAQEEDDDDRTNAQTIVGRSPFTYEFKKVLKEVQGVLEKEDSESTHKEENAYFCPGILDVLFDTYLGIFPLWSGLLLGDLKRYANDKEDYSFVPSKTRDTNCHVERWFGIVKHSILRKQRRLRPGTFVRQMYGSLQGRYREHVMAHNFSERLLLRPISKKDITQSQEGWAKRDGSKPQTAKSKFYTAPSTVPFPKKAKSIKKGSKDFNNRSTDLTREVSEPATEVIFWWLFK